MKLIINIIGAGHLGKTLGYLLAQEPCVQIGAICNSSAMSTNAAIKFIGNGVYCSNIGELPPADVTIIATPDDLITEVCVVLSKNPNLKKDSVVMHCSGTLSSEALSSVSKKGCFVASVHPMRSFAQPEISVTQYQGTYCALEGDEKAIPMVKSLFEKIGSITYEIDKRKKSYYHAAGVFSSNYLITLAHQALCCMKEAGVDQEIAIPIIANLMRGSISNLEKTLSPEHALTGPIQRGDVATIKQHMDALADTEQKTLYSSLGKTTLTLTNHGSKKRRDIEEALN
ncbi:MAG TPA: DUF2520 domain-containing protein [Legionella sp.]|nr:DUF2520 domain-containing protein [Legionella sp.]